MATTTYRNLRYPISSNVPNVPSDIQALASDCDTALQVGGAIICTSTTRPSSPTNGELIWESDTGHRLSYNSSLGAWRYLGNRVVVANATARNALTPFYGGLEAYQSDVNVTFAYDGANLRWAKVPSVPSLIYSNEDAGVSASLGPGASSFGLITALPVPAHQAGALRVEVVCEVAPTASTTTAGYLQLWWANSSSAPVTAFGSRVRFHNYGVSNLIGRTVMASFYSDGTAKWLWLIGWNDASSGGNFQVQADTWQVWQL